MTRPSQPAAVLNFKGHIHTVQRLMQFQIRDLVGLVDIADLTGATVMTDINHSHISNTG